MLAVVAADADDLRGLDWRKQWGVGEGDGGEGLGCIVGHARLGRGGDEGGRPRDSIAVFDCGVAWSIRCVQAAIAHNGSSWGQGLGCEVGVSHWSSISAERALSLPETSVALTEE